MSCTICNGHPNCPVCQGETFTKPCPECDGAAHTYYNANGDEITKEQYDQLPEKERESYPCDRCEGVGEIEYEPEYEYED